MALNINADFTQTQGQAIAYLFDKDTTEILFGGAAGGGKSFIGCAWLILCCLKYPKTRWLIGRSKLDNLKKTTLNTFFEVCELWGLKADKHYKFNGASNIITFFNKSEILLKDLYQYPADPNFDTLGSLEITGCFVDEANQITEKCKNILSSRIRYKLDKYNIKPKLFLTCNPAKNWTYNEFYKPSKNGDLKTHRKFIQSLVDDNEYIGTHYKDQLEKLDELSRQRLLFGNWEYEATTDNLIEYDAILNLFSQTGRLGEKYISVDCARFGTDKSVIVLWEGLHIKKIISIGKSAINELVDEIKKVQQQHAVSLKNIIVDSDGVGGGVQDYMRCRGFVNNSRPLKAENYQNLKTQCYYKLADLVNKAQIGIDCNDIHIKKCIIEEMEMVRSKNADKDAKIQMQPKDTIKAILGRSPDYSDAIMMRMFYEIDSNFGKYFIQ